MPLLNLVQGKYWALHPAKLDEIAAFIEARLDDPKATFEVVKGRSGNRADDRYQVRDGVAIISVYGVLDKRANMFMDASGGTSTELLGRDIKAAMEDSRVGSILLDIDSPGGAVDGTKELADLVFSSRGRKPIVAFANGLMASGAYWIGSAADAIFAGDTAEIGSIGVVATHYDRSKADEQRGIKRTMIAAGKYKRIASDERPLTEEGREYIQESVDEIYSIFVDAVAQNRGVDAETVIKKMADGRVFTGKKALKAGLVDYMGDFEKAFAMAKEKGRTMDIETLKEKHPDIFKAAFDQGAASIDIKKIESEAKQAGAMGEKARVLEILKAEGDQAITLKAIEDGTSFEAAGWLFFKAEKENRSRKLDDMKQLPKSAGHSASETDKETKPGFDKLVEAHMKEHNVSRAKAISAVAKAYPEVHEAWLETCKTGSFDPKAGR